jgi:hypothetical protein
VHPRPSHHQQLNHHAKVHPRRHLACPRSLRAIESFYDQSCPPWMLCPRSPLLFGLKCCVPHHNQHQTQQPSGWLYSPQSEIPCSIPMGDNLVLPNLFLLQIRRWTSPCFSS